MRDLQPRSELSCSSDCCLSVCLSIPTVVRACPEHGCPAWACHDKCDMNLWQKLSLAQVGGAAGRLPGYRARQGGGCASRISGAFLISATPFLCVNAGVFPFLSASSAARSSSL